MALAHEGIGVFARVNRISQVKVEDTTRIEAIQSSEFLSEKRAEKRAPVSAFSMIIRKNSEKIRAASLNFVAIETVLLTRLVVFQQDHLAFVRGVVACESLTKSEEN